jgi:hypothetical protein
MQILSLNPPTDGGTLYSGKAVSKRGRYYTFCATATGRAFAVLRRDISGETASGQYELRCWMSINRDGHRIGTPKALKAAVRTAVRKQRH